MEALGRLMVASANLVEAEGAALRKQVVRLAVAAGLLVVAVSAGLLGLLLLAYAAFHGLALLIGWPGAGAVIGLVVLAVAGGVAWLLRSLLR